MMLTLGEVLDIDDSEGFQRVQAELTDEELLWLERVQQYGFTSVPPKGSQALAGFVGGSRSHGFILATDHPLYRLMGLEEGDAAIYSMTGNRVKVAAAGGIEVVATGGQPIQVTGDMIIEGNIAIEGDIAMTGTLAVTGAITVNGRPVLTAP